MEATVEWDVDKLKYQFNRWRTANEYRPFKVYHFKLIFYLFLQIVEWGTDVMMAVLLLRGDHLNTGTATSFFTVAPSIVISFSLVVKGPHFRKFDSWWVKPWVFVGLFPFTFLRYLMTDVSVAVWLFFWEFTLFTFETIMNMGSREGRLKRMPDQRTRQFIFFRGVYEFWFQSLPQFIIRLVVALRGGVIKREILWFTTFVSAVNVLVHGVKVIRFRSESKLGIWKPAFHAVQTIVTKRKGEKVRPSPKVKVVCSLKEFPWVDMYNDIYEEMYVEKVPSSGLGVFKHVCRLSSRTFALRKIMAPGCEISDAGPLSISYLTEAMRNNHGMKEIDLSRNNLGNEGAGHIADMLRKNSTLEVLNLSKNRIEVEGIRYIAGALRAHNIMLKRLNINRNRIGKEGGESLGYLLRFSFTLECLSLVDCLIGNEGIKGLACGLRTNSTLKFLDLDTNRIDHQGTECLGEAVHQNRHLVELILANNAIGDEGVCHICDALDENYTLEKLNLKNTSLTSTGAGHLARMLKINNMLQHLELGDNQLGDKGVETIVEALVLNTSLKKVGLMNNGIGAKGTAVIAKFLEEDSVVTELDLSQNEIDDEGARMLGDAVRVNTMLEVLKLSGNRITPEAALAVEHALAHHGIVAVESNRGLNKEGGGNETALVVDTLIYSRIMAVPDVDGAPTQVQIATSGLEAEPLGQSFYSQTHTSQAALLTQNRTNDQQGRK
ncbi:hypothetical protein BSKO_08133 [Bryopsis sp. KO-2023]|nr:hypothetical protein BSKO_08133 [Bryopsis sp. KO-2023]